MRTLVGKTGVLTLAAMLGWAGTAAAKEKWTAFGNADVVKVRGDWVISLTSDVRETADEDEAFAGVAFTPKKEMTFSDIKRLSADYLVAEGGMGGGSPRFQIAIGDGDGNFVGNVFVYLGTPPAFDDAPDGWQSTGNLIGSTDLRFDTTQVGGTFYDDYAGVAELVGEAEVLGVQLVVDGGWATEDGVQTVLVDDVRVNNVKLTGKNVGEE